MYKRQLVHELTLAIGLRGQKLSGSVSGRDSLGIRGRDIFKITPEERDFTILFLFQCPAYSVVPIITRLVI